MRLTDIEFLRNNSLFTELSNDDLQSLAADSRVAEHPRGHSLFLHGDTAASFYLVTEGCVSVFRDTPDGSRTVLHIAHEGETFAEAAALKLGHYPASAEAASDCTLIEIPAIAFRDVLRRDPDLALRVIGSLSIRLRMLVNEVEQLTVKNASQRVGGFLLGLVSETEKNQATVSLPYEKALVAAKLGMKPESLSRALANLRQIGVESSRGAEIRLRDVSSLRQFCLTEM
jgi:CRP-like cAMP-binding protein